MDGADAGLDLTGGWYDAGERAFCYSPHYIPKPGIRGFGDYSCIPVLFFQRGFKLFQLDS